MPAGQGLARVAPVIEFAQSASHGRPRQGPALQPLHRLRLQQAKPNRHSRLPAQPNPTVFSVIEHKRNLPSFPIRYSVPAQPLRCSTKATK